MAKGAVFAANQQKARAWIAAWRQRSAQAQALTAEAAAVAVGQPLSVRHDEQEGMRAALSSAGSLAGAGAADHSATDDTKQSMIAARQGDVASGMAPSAGH